MSNHPVFIIDDDEAMRHALLTLLRADGLRARDFCSGDDFFQRLPEVPTACVVTDIRMPGMGGAEVVRRVAELEQRNWLVIVLTAHADVPLAVQLMKAGIVDFIEKPFEPERLLESLRGCASLLDALAFRDAAAKRTDERLTRLTPRERQVFDALVKGGSNKIIAAELGISPRTVEIFRSNVMKKMGAESLSDLVRMDVNSGLRTD